MFKGEDIFRKLPLARLVAVALLILSGSALASTTDSLMSTGNAAYQSKDFPRAIAAYQELTSLGYEGTSLYYNLGNSYYRAGKIGLAILYYEKASRLSPGDEDVAHNLAIANARTVDKLDALPRFFVFQWWESLLALFSLSGWTHVVFTLYIISLFAFGLYFLARQRFIQRNSFFVGLAATLLLILSISIGAVKLNRELTVRDAIVIEPTAVVKLAPDPTSNDAFVVHEGLKVRELDEVENWVKIRLQDGKLGWIQKDEIATI